MRETIVATPFGRRPMTLASLARQINGAELPQNMEVSKWQVFGHLREARERLGVTDRSLAILNALLSFHPETTLTPNSRMIVWPSNEQLASRANGMSMATLRRHLAVLVEAGLIHRRDSPNGKRFARKGEGGSVLQAYGFDLTPLLTRATEFRLLSEAIVADRMMMRALREQLTICRRDIVKLIETGRNADVPSDWNALHARYQNLIDQLPRKATKSLLQRLNAELALLRLEILNILKAFDNALDLRRTESHNETHIQESNPDSSTEPKRSFGMRNEAAPTNHARPASSFKSSNSVPLSAVLNACSNLRDLSSNREIRNWRDFADATTLVRSMLQISPSAWHDACQSLGEQQAAITLGAIYQCSDRINNPGGYLRTLSRRAKLGQFSTGPMIMALHRKAQADAPRLKVTEEEQSDPSDAPMPATEIPVSDALLRSLKRSTQTGRLLQPTARR
jgi:replication initiation protein RepC